MEKYLAPYKGRLKFPISRDPPEGGTQNDSIASGSGPSCFQFLGIPPKGELPVPVASLGITQSFQFLGIPPKGELPRRNRLGQKLSRFQFLGIPPKGELYPY